MSANPAVRTRLGRATQDPVQGAAVSAQGYDAQVEVPGPGVRFAMAPRNDPTR